MIVWTKLDYIGQKWTRLDEIEHDLTKLKIICFSTIWTKLDKMDKLNKLDKMDKKDLIGHNWTKMDKNEFN